MPVVTTRILRTARSFFCNTWMIKQFYLNFKEAFIAMLKFCDFRNNYLRRDFGAKLVQEIGSFNRIFIPERKGPVKTVTTFVCCDML